MPALVAVTREMSPRLPRTLRKGEPQALRERRAQALLRAQRFGGPLPPGPGPPCRVPAVWPESQSSAPSPLSGQTRPRPPLRPLCGAASPLWAAPPVSHVYAPLLSLCPMVRASAGRAGGDSPSASQPKPKTRRTPCLGGSAHPFSSLQPLPTTPPSRCIPSGRLCSWEPPGQAWPGTPKPPHMLPGPRSQQASGHRPWAQHARREAGLALAKDGGHGCSRRGLKTGQGPGARTAKAASAPLRPGVGSSDTLPSPTSSPGPGPGSLGGGRKAPRSLWCQDSWPRAPPGGHSR